MSIAKDKRKDHVLFLFVSTWDLSSSMLNEEIGCWTHCYMPYRNISLWIIFSSIKLHCRDTWHWWTSRYLYWNFYIIFCVKGFILVYFEKPEDKNDSLESGLFFWGRSNHLKFWFPMFNPTAMSLTSTPLYQSHDIRTHKYGDSSGP